MTVAAPQPLSESAAIALGETAPRRGPGHIAIACGVLLATAVVLLYLRTAWFEFVNLDDLYYVVYNPLIQDGLTWRGILTVFTTLDMGNWYPLTSLSFMLDCQLYGATHATGYHLTNVALHALNASLLFFVLWRMTRPRSAGPDQASQPDAALRAEYWSLGQSAFVAAVFALHPLRVESVAWIMERKDVLSGMFWILTIGAYAWYSRHPSWQRYLAVVVVFALGLMSKPSVVTLPAVLLLLDYWPLGRFGEPGRRPCRSRVCTLLLEKLPLLAMSLALAVVTSVPHGETGALYDLKSWPIHARLENVVVAYAAYLRDTFWPVGLACFYPMDYFVSDGQPYLPIAKVIGSLVVLLAITAVVALLWRRYPFLAVGWLWYLIILVPMIGLVQLSKQARADRYTYLPSIGLAIMVAWGLPALLSGWRRRAVALGAAGVVCLAACVVLSWFQIGTWRDSETLWRHALAVTKKNYFAHNGLGLVSFDRHELDAAIGHFEQAIRDAAPGRIDTVPFNLSLALHEKAKEYLREGYIEKALKCCRRALEVRPDWDEMANHLAWMLATRPEPDLRSESEALFLAKKLCAADGSKTPAYLDTLAAAYAASGQYVDAVRTGEAAVRLAEAGHDEATAERIRARVELYRSGKPLRTP